MTVAAGEMPSGRLVATSQHRENDAWSWNAHLDNVMLNRKGGSRNRDTPKWMVYNEL